MIATGYPYSVEALRSLAADLSAPVEAATLALVRLDERLARVEPTLADGARERAHLLEAQALVHLGGETVGLEELVLHDAGMDARTPGTGTVRAARLLAERRSLARRRPEAVLAPEAVRRMVSLRDAPERGDGPLTERAGEAAKMPGRQDLRGEQPMAATMRNSPRPWDMPLPLGEDDNLWPEEDEPEPEEPLRDDDEAGKRSVPRRAGGSIAPIPEEADWMGADLAEIDRLLARTRRTLAIEPKRDGPPDVRLRDPAYGAEERLAAWLAALEESRRLPGALASAITLDAWLILEPTERGGEGGWALAATVLRQRGLAAHHLPALGLAHRRGKFRWGPHMTRERRLEGLLAAVEGSAALAAADLQRLTLAREVMLRRCAGRRVGSKLQHLVDIFVGSPLVTTALATEKLGVTPQAVEAMLKELGSSLPRELTGRKRYRAWGIV